jgi:cytochrome c oxidase subunit II
MSEQKNEHDNEMHSGVVGPKGIWWLPVGKQERLWVTIAFAWCLILFAAMPFWHIKGGQNVSGIRSKVEPAQFEERVNRFIADYQVGTENGLPVVEPPPGSDIFLLARMWQFTPVLKLQKGATYTLHMSSTDINHGFGLHPMNINFQIVPGYSYGLKITPNEAGDYRIVCNEFCGIAHHIMVGKILVEE